MSRQDSVVDVISDDDKLVVIQMEGPMKRPKARLSTWAHFRVLVASALGLGEIQEQLEQQALIIEATSQELASVLNLRATLESIVAAEGRARLDADIAFGHALDVVASRVKALEDTHIRMELVTGTVVTAGGAVAKTFAKPFKAPPQIIAIPGWAGAQMIDPVATKVTASGTEIVVKRSRATLLLSAGPFEDAPAGTPFSALAIGI